uniref:Uncharacterized protein n=1 Tax=Anguilla anguilla TaxID=7936 RepID=A0A0E9VZ96_ANGAN
MPFICRNDNFSYPI